MKNKQPLIIIQARTGSTRLPNKMVLPHAFTKTIPEIIISTLANFFNKNQIVIATSDSPKDDILIDLAIKNNINHFRGSESDVLDRFIKCAEQFSSDILIRICADNPFLQPQYLCELVNTLTARNLDYCSFEFNDHTPVMLSHVGIFGEAFTKEYLKRIESKTNNPLYREHVTNYLYSHKDEFLHEFLKVPDYLKEAKEIRLTVDTIQDFNFTKELYEKEYNNVDFNIEDLILELRKNQVFLNKMRYQIQENEK